MSENYTFFYGGVFSNWYPLNSQPTYSVEQLQKPLFTVNNIEYNTAEQFMMAQKAILFDDHETLSQIMQPCHPRDAKKLGRKVKNFNPAIWDKVAPNMILPGLFAKYTQNHDLLAKLLDTRDTVLVEASPHDTIWGIGLAANDPRALTKATWQGTNKLGYCLSFVRDTLDCMTQRNKI